MPLCLVVKDWALYSRPVHGLELSPHDTVPDSDEHSLLKAFSTPPNNCRPDDHHDSVEHSQVSLLLEVALSVDIHVPHEEVGARDPHVVEAPETVVFCEEAYFGANITGTHALDVFVGLKIS